MKLFVAPHNDDETLFGAFTILREKPKVLIVYDSHAQPARGHVNCSWGERRRESLNALRLLGIGEPIWGGLSDLRFEARPVIDLLVPYRNTVTEVWIPAVEEGGNAHHNLVGEFALENFRQLSRVHRYLTYTVRGKSAVEDKAVKIEQPWWIEKKLRAMACYTSQLALASTQPHFLRDLYEYELEL